MQTVSWNLLTFRLNIYHAYSHTCDGALEYVFMFMCACFFNGRENEAKRNQKKIKPLHTISNYAEPNMLFKVLFSSSSSSFSFMCLTLASLGIHFSFLKSSVANILSIFGSCFARMNKNKWLNKRSGIKIESVVSQKKKILTTTKRLKRYEKELIVYCSRCCLCYCCVVLLISLFRLYLFCLSLARCIHFTKRIGEWIMSADGIQ